MALEKFSVVQSSEIMSLCQKIRDVAGVTKSLEWPEDLEYQISENIIKPNNVVPLIAGHCVSFYNAQFSSFPYQLGYMHLFRDTDNKHLKTISLPNCETIRSSAFQNLDQVELVSLPKVTTLPDGVFSGLGSALPKTWSAGTVFYLPNVTSIELYRSYTFANTRIKELVCPALSGPYSQLPSHMFVNAAFSDLNLNFTSGLGMPTAMFEGANIEGSLSFGPSHSFYYIARSAFKNVNLNGQTLNISAMRFLDDCFQGCSNGTINIDGLQAGAGAADEGKQAFWNCQNLNVNFNGITYKAFPNGMISDPINCTFELTVVSARGNNASQIITSVLPGTRLVIKYGQYYFNLNAVYEYVAHTFGYPYGTVVSMMRKPTNICPTKNNFQCQIWVPHQCASEITGWNTVAQMGFEIVGY